MPTLNWIQETALNRYWERGSQENGEKIESVYSCRICGQHFNSIYDRDQHEISHPVLNPTIFVAGKEICGESVDITSELAQQAIYLRNVEYLSINGIECQEEELGKRIVSEKRTFLDVRYGNANIEKRLKIRICIADIEELKSVDEAFLQCFESGYLNDTLIVAFTEKVRNFETVGSYCDGLVRYLQGLMAKDNRSELYGFEAFVERFNQATGALRNYETGLSHAVRAVVNFNRNDFGSIHRSGIPMLDCAVRFFQGGELLEANSSGATHILPVDFATESIMSRLLFLYRKGSLGDLEAEIETFSPKYLSLQDRSKFEYVCWRKSIQINNRDAEKSYLRRLRHDEVFSGIVEKR